VGKKSSSSNNNNIEKLGIPVFSFNEAKHISIARSLLCPYLWESDNLSLESDGRKLRYSFWNHKKPRTKREGGVEVE
jgi:hypothetical protein